MSSVMQQGLLITVIGMGLVFAVIVFLWWLMGLLVRATTKEDQPLALETGDEEGLEGLATPGQPDLGVKRRAAAAAVAVAMALEKARSHPQSGQALEKMGGGSPWQSLHRARQLERHTKRG